MQSGSDKRNKCSFEETIRTNGQNEGEYSERERVAHNDPISWHSGISRTNHKKKNKLGKSETPSGEQEETRNKEQYRSRYRFIWRDKRSNKQTIISRLKDENCFLFSFECQPLDTIKQTMALQLISIKCGPIKTVLLIICVLLVVADPAEANVLFGQASTVSLTTAQSGKFKQLRLSRSLTTVAVKGHSPRCKKLRILLRSALKDCVEVN